MASNQKQIKTMITSLALKKYQLAGEMSRLSAEISKKHDSINKFEVYYKEYKEKTNKESTHTISTYINNQKFLDRIVDTLAKEKDKLKPLENQRDNLISRYNGYQQKLDGLEELLNSMKQEQRAIQDKYEDNQRNELAVTRAAHKLMEINNERYNNS